MIRRALQRIRGRLLAGVALLDRLANHQRLFRRLVLVWACSLITWVVVRTWTDPPDLAMGTATALASVVGILATVVGFYQWHRQRDEEGTRARD